MRTELALLLAVAAVVFPLDAQQPFVNKVEVTVVNVDVVVTTPDGKPVRGLTQNDFQIFEDGAAQPITNFYAVESGAPAAAPASTAAAAPAEKDPRFRRKVLVLIDSLHISKRSRDLALKNLESFINDRFRGGEYDWSIAALGSHAGAVVPLTSDKKVLHDALQAIRSNQSRQEAGRFGDLANQNIDVRNANWTVMNTSVRGGGTPFFDDADDRERVFQAGFTTEAVIEAARAFAGAEGKKIILLLTDDTGLGDIEQTKMTARAIRTNDNRAFRQRPVSQDLADSARRIAELRDRIIREANASNVSFYIINVEGLRAPGDIGVSGSPMSNNQGAFWLAEETGGKLMPGNDGVKALEQFETASSNFYSLGFRPAHDDGKYHRITVKVTRPGDYKLQYRTGYSKLGSDAEIERALLSPIATTLGSSDLPVTLTTDKAQPQQQQKDAVLVPFTAAVPVGKLQFVPAGNGWSARIDIYVSVFDQAGKNILVKRYTVGASSDSPDPDPSGNFIYKNAVLLRKGQTHRLVVAVRDQATDAVGMADRTVKF